MARQEDMYRCQTMGDAPFHQEGRSPSRTACSHGNNRDKHKPFPDRLAP